MLSVVPGSPIGRKIAGVLFLRQPLLLTLPDRRRALCISPLMVIYCRPRAGIDRLASAATSSNCYDGCSRLLATIVGRSMRRRGLPSSIRNCQTRSYAQAGYRRLILLEALCGSNVLAPVALLRDRPAVLFCPLNVVPFLASCPTVVCVHDLAFLRFPELRRPAQRRYLTVLTRLSVHRAAHVLTVSEFTRREVIDLLGLAPEKVTAIPNGGDERIGPVAADVVDEFRKAKELPEQFLLSLSTLEPRKNLTNLATGLCATARGNRDAVDCRGR